MDSLRRSIAVVPQDSVLFHDTIFYNLHYGNLEKSADQVYEASKLADLHASVLQWPKGYGTEVNNVKPLHGYIRMFDFARHNFFRSVKGG